MFRKSSISRDKKQQQRHTPPPPLVLNEVDSTSTPPRSRAASMTSTSDQDTTGSVKRKQSKTLKSLKSIFNKSSSTPPRSPSAGAVTSSSSTRSLASSPTSPTKPRIIQASDIGLGSVAVRADGGRQAEGQAFGEYLPSTTDIHTVNGTTDAQSITVPHIVEERSPSTSALTSPPQDFPVTSPISPVSPTSYRQPSTLKAGNRPRVHSVSGESVWSLDEDGLSEAGSDDEGFVTPDEGLSEVGEDEDEEVAKPPATKEPFITPAPGPPAYSRSSALNGDSSTPPSSLVKISPEAAAAAAAAILDARPLTKEEQSDILDSDLVICHRTMNLFLSSKIVEAEETIRTTDGGKQRLYVQAADSILKCLKGLLTFEATDLAAALESTRHTTSIALGLRKTASSAGRLAGLVSSRGPGSVYFIAGMTRLERHAELVYAETLLLKAIIGIISGGEWMALVKEALNMRTGDGIYRSLAAYLKEADKNGRDDSIDMDFRSGVELGTGVAALMLSLLPGKALKLAEIFGYSGSRAFALSELSKSGGWSIETERPGISAEEEGVRRPISDLVILAFHLVISSLIPVDGVNVPFAERVLSWNLKRYPEGIFTLFFQGRLHTTQNQPKLAIDVLNKAVEVQSAYVQLQLICRWDIGLNHLTLLDMTSAARCFEQMYTGSNWSKATYIYSEAAALIEVEAAKKEKDGESEATDLKIKDNVDSVKGNIRKLVGKSIPIEKFVARKARKFQSQGRLVLPALELSYVFGSYQHTPSSIAQTHTIPAIDRVLSSLAASNPESYGEAYWDDFILASFLKGVALGYVALPLPEVVVLPTDSTYEGDRSIVLSQAMRSLQDVLDHAPDVVYEHWICFHALYEKGTLYERQGEYKLAIECFETVMSGKIPHMSPTSGKYSLHSALVLRCHASLQKVRDLEKKAGSTR